MSKRDNPRLWANAETSGKNKRSAHRVQKDGHLGASSDDRYSKSKSSRSGKTAGKSYEKTTRSERAYSSKPSRPVKEERSFEENPNLIIGRNPVMEAVKSGRSIDKIMMQKDAEGSAKKIASLARERKIVVQYVDKIALDKLAPGRPHQGVAAYAAAKNYVSVDEIFALAEKRGEDPLIVILDGIEDPHNLGAILRSCDGVGAHGVIIPARRAVGLTEVVAKASAGAIEYIPVAKVTNLAQTIEELKEKGLWIASVDMDGENYSDAKLTGPLALVIGGEGQGVSEIVRKNSDYIVSMPMKGKVNSLNASNAAAIMLYEVDRQRNLNK